MLVCRAHFRTWQIKAVAMSDVYDETSSSHSLGSIWGMSPYFKPYSTYFFCCPINNPETFSCNACRLCFCQYVPKWDPVDRDLSKSTCSWQRLYCSLSLIPGTLAAWTSIGTLMYLHLAHHSFDGMTTGKAAVLLSTWSAAELALLVAEVAACFLPFGTCCGCQEYDNLGHTFAEWTSSPPSYTNDESRALLTDEEVV